MKKATLIILSAITLTSCGTKYKYVHTSTKQYEPIPETSVAVITDNKKIPAQHEEVGIVICKGSKEYKSFRKAKKKAAAHGANAIYLMNSKDNNILISRDVDQQEKAYNVERGSEFATKITFMAIYVPASK